MPSGNPILDASGDPMITALNLSDGTLVKTSDNQDITATGSGVIGAGSVTMELPVTSRETFLPSAI